ncbi:MAG: beta-ketoacyl synthase N-terminal-like domain-containing protein [Dehalococcoidia bacterium]|nr:beta-ketoacyl synthase N-terminal-like domain-containing protein [Dehalococcoidia bacterium]
MSTAGSGVDPAWGALCEKRPAGRPYRLDDSGREFFAAALPDDYRAHPDIPRNLSHFLDRGGLIALDAALQAVAMADLGAGAGDSRRFALSDGQAYRAPGQPTLFVPYGQLVARALGTRGPVILSGGHNASGMAAIAAAVRLLRRGDADVVVCGAAQALQTNILEHAQGEGWCAPAAPRPLDREHAGTTPGEGAAYLVLETESHARERGVEPVAAIAGLGEIFDPGAEPLQVSEAPEAGRTMQAALGDSGYLQNQVDIVVSCADGRPDVDYADADGIRRTFGRHAYYAGVTTAAGSLGHTFAASGPVSLVVALEALRRQEAPPIAGFTEGEGEPPLAHITEQRQERLDCALVTSLGAGGTNVSFVLQRPPGA